MHVRIVMKTDDQTSLEKKTILQGILRRRIF